MEKIKLGLPGRDEEIEVGQRVPPKSRYTQYSGLMQSLDAHPWCEANRP